MTVHEAAALHKGQVAPFTIRADAATVPPGPVLVREGEARKRLNARDYHVLVGEREAFGSEFLDARLESGRIVYEGR